MAAGTVLLSAALFLLLYNWNQDSRAEQRASDILEQLKEQMPEPHRDEPELMGMGGDYAAMTGTTADLSGYIYETTEKEIPVSGDLIAEYIPEEPAEEIVWWIDGDAYLGTLAIPALGLELPVLSEWSYPNLRIAPCRYTGTAEEGNLVIAAHNYNSHFGYISSLNSGDEIIFTDGSGVMHTYNVVHSELINGGDAPAMETGDEEWDLTLFTCNLSGTSRVTVRAALAE